MQQPQPDLTVRPRDVRESVKSYRALHDAGGGSVSARKQRYSELVRGYYDLVTDFYEQGWGDSFHFAPRYGREPFEASIRRHQHYLAQRLQLTPRAKVLDVGCGVGGPMREIARFTGAEVIGINNNTYQVQKARSYNEAARLGTLCTVLDADFMHMPLEADSIDAAYAFEATCHAPDKTALFKEVHRTLRKGARFAFYEWCLTDRYDSSRTLHCQIKRDIEEGNGLPDIWTIDQTAQSLLDAGFEVLERCDRAAAGDPERPWYLSLTGRESSNTGLRRSKWGQKAVRLTTRVLEMARVAPRGSAEVVDFLNVGADALVAGGELSVFTPMAFFAAQKPR